MHPQYEPFVDRRKQTRVKRVFKPAMIKADGISTVGMLRDISGAGIGLEVEEGLFQVGQNIECVWGCNDPLSGTVIWAEDGRIGVASHVPDTKFEDTSTQYRSVRIPVTAGANIYLDGKRLVAETVNFAQKGFCAVVSGKIRHGALATIEIGRRSFFNATAKWMKGEKAGFAIAQPLSIGEMQHLYKDLQA